MHLRLPAGWGQAAARRNKFALVDTAANGSWSGSSLLLEVEAGTASHFGQKVNGLLPRTCGGGKIGRYQNSNRGAP